MNACLRRATRAHSVSYDDDDNEGVEIPKYSKRRKEVVTLFFVQFNSY